MKSLKNYWFLQDPIDVEHKFYVLMDFLQSVEDDIDQKKYNDQIQKIRRIREDLKTFKDNSNLSSRTLVTMTQEDIEKFESILSNLDGREEEVKDLIDNSLNVIDGFIEKIDPIIQGINHSIITYVYNSDKRFKDQGFLILRIPGKKEFKVYSWSFSFQKVRKKDQIGMSITELLDPLPKYSKIDKKIVSFFENEIKVYNPSIDSFIFVDLDPQKKDLEIGFDLLKERGIQFIAEEYQKFLSA